MGIMKIIPIPENVSDDRDPKFKTVIINLPFLRTMEKLLLTLWLELDEPTDPYKFVYTCERSTLDTAVGFALHHSV